MVKTQDTVFPAYESGLDWLSLTAPSGSESAARFAVWCESEKDKATADGAPVQETSPQGYKGTRCGGVFSGIGRYGWLFQISGALSNDALQFIRKERNDFRCTRIDYQVGQRFNEADGLFPERMRGIIRSAEGREGKARQSAITLYEGCDGSGGVTVGSRISGSYLRIYNKSAESKLTDVENLWRFEVETKREVSRGAWASVVACDDIPRLCRSVVAKKLRKLRLPVPFVVEEDALHLPVERHQTDDERRAIWFMDTVLPTVAKIEDESLRRACRRRFELHFGSSGS